jgi:hypothetical protein
MLGLAACSDRFEVTAPNSDGRVAPTNGPRYFVDGEYPTDSEYYEELGSVAPLTWADGNPSAHFSSDLSQWIAHGRLGFEYANVGNGSLEGKILNTTGELINSGEDTWAFDQFLPKIGAEYHDFNVAISTSNNNCDIVGKARLQGQSHMKLLNHGTLLTLWSAYLDQSAPDVTLPACPRREDECQASYVGGPCNESGTNDNDGEGGGGGGGATGGGGGDPGSGGPGCVLWLWKGYVSRDEGATWTYEYSYYEWECP